MCLVSYDMSNPVTSEVWMKWIIFWLWAIMLLHCISFHFISAYFQLILISVYFRYFDYFDYVYFVFGRLFCRILSRHAGPLTLQGRCMNVVIQQINPPSLLRGPVEWIHILCRSTSDESDLSLRFAPKALQGQTPNHFFYLDEIPP